MKKILALVLAVVMIMAMVIPTYAAMPETVEPQACIHPNLPIVERTFVEHRYYDGEYCKSCFDIVRECTEPSCNYRKTETEWIHGTETKHEHSLYDATCNGTNQTWYYRCKFCSGDSYIDPNPHPCPRPHSGGICTYLPI